MSERPEGDRTHDVLDEAGLIQYIMYSLPSASLRGAMPYLISMSMPSSILSGSGSMSVMLVLTVPPPSRSAIAETKGTSMPGKAR